MIPVLPDGGSSVPFKGPHKGGSLGCRLRDASGLVFWEVHYYRKLTLHEIKVLEINATSINANLMENDFRIEKINAKKEVKFHNKGN